MLISKRQGSVNTLTHQLFPSQGKKGGSGSRNRGLEIETRQGHATYTFTFKHAHGEKDWDAGDEPGHEEGVQ